MEKEEWLGYVHKVEKGPYPLPAFMISDYDNWHCRSIVGRMLYIYKDIEAAMTVLATVRDVEPDMEDNPEMGLSDCEHKVLCLRDIAEIIWQLTGNLNASLQYLKEAERLCHEYKYVFRSADRGYIWERQLELKRACSLEMEALQEAAAMLKAQADKKEEINPYRYYAYKFIAEDAAERGQYPQAVALLQEGYKTFPLTDAGQRDIAEALAEETAEKQYEQLHHCTTIQYRPWEAFDVPTVDEVRKRQYQRYLERLAKEAAQQEEES